MSSWTSGFAKLHGFKAPEESRSTEEKNHLVARTMLAVALSVAGLLIALYLVKEALLFWLFSSARL
jgi:hypothetical protein